MKLVAEHREASVVRRASAELTEHPMLVVGDIKLSKGVLQIVPKKRSIGPALKFPLKAMVP